jgi:serine/threonine-protein kinase RsbW
MATETAAAAMQPLQLPGTLDALDDVASFVRRAASRASLDERRAYRLRLAADELATNIITHGYADDRRGSLLVSATLTDRQLRLTIEDSGPPFNLVEQAPRCDVEAPLASRAEGGLGVYLIFKAVDDLAYEFEDGHNRTTLVMNRDGAAP